MAPEDAAEYDRGEYRFRDFVKENWEFWAGVATAIPLCTWLFLTKTQEQATEIIFQLLWLLIALLFLSAPFIAYGFTKAAKESDSDE